MAAGFPLTDTYCRMIPQLTNIQGRPTRGPDVDRLSTWGRRRLRRLGYRSYYRLVAVNYARRWFAPENATPAGAFRSYELLPRHGSDTMLAALDAHCGPEAVIYDLGANVGVYSLALAADAPDRRLLAVEPAPETSAHLRANVECNDLGDRIEVVECGVGDADDTRPFFVSTYPELSGFDRESATRWEADLAETVDVPIRRVDTGRRADPACRHAGRLPPSTRHDQNRRRGREPRRPPGGTGDARHPPADTVHRGPRRGVVGRHRPGGTGDPLGGRLRHRRVRGLLAV